ncbi:phenylacetic acid degradation operon negative regulatory protein PaaX [bacterium SCSIO 12696]|nr:phenylacetic acid degradation operon negative regulatory protein PaaX [bacterium SCSIO 12696]
MRAGSLVVTLFGDTISQHGNSVWLGSVIRVLEPLGLNQRLVRTAVYRLMQDDWLFSEQIGRKSYYSLTASGLRRYQKAAQRIYAADHGLDGGDWLFVYLNELAEKQRELLRKELRWLGFGNLFPGVMAKPGVERVPLDETLVELGVQEQVVVMRCQPDDGLSAEQLCQRVFDCWNLEQLQQQYREFLVQFAPLHKRFNKGDGLDQEASFQLRTLLIHEYRRLLLKDAELPQELLPADWEAKEVHDMTADLYRQIQENAMAFAITSMETANGCLPDAEADYFSRFGGL